MTAVKQAIVAALLVGLTAPAASGQPAADPGDPSIQAFLASLESTLSHADRAQWVALLSPNADRLSSIEFFDTAVGPGVTRAVVRERDRLPLDGALPGEGYRLLTDVFFESGSRGRISTWRIDVRRPRESNGDQPWRMLAFETIAGVDGLHRLTLDATRQYTARSLLITSVDLELRVPRADVFVIDTADGVTGLVVLGDGTMIFAPRPPEERGQVRLFAGSETIDTPFTAAYLRLNPLDFEQTIEPQLTPRPEVDARQLRRAQQIFDEEVGKSFSLDLRDLSRDDWSLLPQVGDFLAEIRTRRFDTLTFARAMNEPEDVSLFHRAKRRNIASYASEAKLAVRGRFYDEDDLAEYDVLHYDIDAAFAPDRSWIDGRARLTLKIKAFALGALTLKLADALTVSSITSPRLGRLMFLRVRNQNNVVVNLPMALPEGQELTLEVAYGGPVSAQAIDQESVDQGAQGRVLQPRADELPFVPPEPHWLLSNRSHWYPQSPVTDYATASIRFGVPLGYGVIASGVHSPDSPVVVAQASSGSPGRQVFVYEVRQPVRYLAAVVSRFERVDRAAIALDVESPRTTVTLAIEANRRQVDRGRDLMLIAAEILQFYARLIGQAPYDALTIAMVEHERPGGHSPGYFAVLNNPPPVTTYSYRHDPASFTGFPEFYVAHEIAHQWWGQAVGWKNYHEQWLSEGFAQYFAALYAQERRGEAAFRAVIQQFHRWAMDQSDQGAVYLGYRLGHIKGDSRVFRAIAYNKGAAVLHMLRRLVGDDAFFDGLRRYYHENLYRKAGTDDLRRAMEEASGRPLARFFERWVYASGLPRIRYQTRTEGDELVVRFEQTGEDIYDLPVTITLRYADRTTEHVVPITAAVVEHRLPVTGALRDVIVNDDRAALAEFFR